MPPGAEVTEPLPTRGTVSVCVALANVAVTVTAAVIGTVHGAVPVQVAPLQPVNVEPAAATAVKVVIWPATYVSVQSAPQLMPAGLDVTVPVPVPPRVTNSVTSSSAK